MFALGDRVAVVDDTVGDGTRAYIGRTGTVVRLASAGNTFYRVLLDGSSRYIAFDEREVIAVYDPDEPQPIPMEPGEDEDKHPPNI